MDQKQIEILVGSNEYELIETHISWVLLDTDFVYKIKKPVKFSFLDFSSLEKRKFFCEEEVRLNRRLSPQIYLGVVPITLSNVKIELDGTGKTIGYTVKMKRLPQEKRMDELLKEGKVTKSHIVEIATIVAEFHKKIDVIEDRSYSSAEVVKKQIDDLSNFRDIIDEACGLGADVDVILQKSDSFIEENKALFEKRQRSGSIRDCHGDLHSQNIFITDEIMIFDCIEFSKDFRYVDIASEIAFMAMDLDAFGREDYSKVFVDMYVELSSDLEALELLPLYKCYRANVRAKIAAIDYSQHPGQEPKERIKKYIELAEKYAELLNGK